MLGAPSENMYGANTSSTAALSPVHFNPSDKSKEWLGSRFGRCWKVTATANIPGKGASTTKTVVLKVVNLCPTKFNLGFFCLYVHCHVSAFYNKDDTTLVINYSIIFILLHIF